MKRFSILKIGAIINTIAFIAMVITNADIELVKIFGGYVGTYTVGLFALLKDENEPQ